MSTEAIARLTAGLISGAVLLAMLPPLSHAWIEGRSLFEAIWSLVRMFTIITNLLVGLVFARLAWKGSNGVSPLVVGGTMLAIVLVGVVFNLLLAMLPHQTIWDAIGDYTHHMAVPLLVPLWWVLFCPHGKLKWSAPFVWALYPLGYSAYTFVHAQFMPPGSGITSRYPYFFMDVDQFGLAQVAFNMTAIAAGFVLVGLLAIVVDRWLGRMPQTSVRDAT